MLLFSEDVQVTVKLTIKKYASEMSWSFASSSWSCSGSRYTTTGVHTKTCNLLVGDYRMQCIDSYGDGWHGGYIEVLGNKYCSGFTSGKSKTNGVITVTYSTGPVIHGKNVDKT